MAEKVFQKDDVLLAEGQTGTEAYLIQSGYVNVTRMEDDQELFLATKAEGTIVGEMALLDETVNSATVIAGCELTVDVVTKADLESMVAAAPERLQVILHQIFESLRTANDIISMYAARPPE